jgi:short-subunit dehydrogenase
MNTLYSTYKNKVVVVAGGASGIGEHLVRQLSPFASHIVIVDRNKKLGTTLAKQLNGSLTAKIDYENVEMTDSVKVKKVLVSINKSVGPIDYFFNTAGIFMAGEMRDTPIENWNAVMDANISPMINGSSIMYEIMQKNGHGHIVNFASAAGLMPIPIMSIYGATKHAIVGMTLGLRMEAASFNIKISVACPTVVNTPLYDTAIYNSVNQPKALKLAKSSKIQTPDVAARKIIRATAQNKPIIHTAVSTKLGKVLFELSPSVYIWATQRLFRYYRETMRSK